MPGSDNNLEIGVGADTDPAAASFEKLIDGAKAETKELGQDFDRAAEKLKKLGGEVPLKTTQAEGELKKLEAAAGKAANEAARLVSEAKKSGSAEGWDKASASIEKLRERIAAAAGSGGDVSRLEAQLASLESETSELGSQFAATERVFGKLAASVEANSPRMGRALVPARNQLDRLKEAIDKARATGGPVPPEWLARLDKFETDLGQATVKAGQFRKSQKDVNDELRQATINAGETEGQVNSLLDAIILKFPKAEQAIIAGFLALATFKQAFSETRQIVEGLKKFTGIDIDAAIQGRFSQLLTDYDAFIDKLFHAGEAEQNLANMTRLLDAQGIKHDGTVKGITKAYEGLDEELRKVHIAVEKIKDIQAAFVEAAAGVGVDKLKERITSLLHVFSEFNGDFDALARSPLFDKFTSELSAVGIAVDQFGDEFRKSLTGKDLSAFDALLTNFQRLVRDKLAGSLVEARLALKEFGVQTPAEVRKVADSFLTFVDVLGGVGKVTAEQAKKIHDEALRLIGVIAQQPKAQRAAASELVKELDRIVLAYGAAADSAEHFAEDSYAVQKAALEKIAALLRKHAEELQSFSANVHGTFAELLKLTQKPLGPLEGAADRQQAESELAGLKGKPVKSADDLKREFELEDQLKKTTSATGSQAEANQRLSVSADATATAVQRLWEQLKAGGQEFANLSALEREEVEVLFSRLQESAATAGKVSADEIDGAFRRIDSILFEADLNAKLLGKGLADVGVQAQGFGANVAATAPQLAAASDAAKAAGQAASASAGGFREAGDAAKEGSAGIIAWSGGVVEISKATGEATKGILGFSPAFKEAGDAAGDAAGDFIKVTDSAHKLSDDTKRLKDDFVGIGQGARGAGEPLRQVGEAAEQAGEGLKRAGEGVAGLEKVGTAAGRVAPQVGALAKEGAAVARLKLGAEFTEIGEGIEKAAKRLPDLVKAMGAFLDLAKGGGPAGDQIEALFRKAADGVGDLDGKLDSVVKKLRLIKTLAGEISKALAAASIDK